MMNQNVKQLIESVADNDLQKAKAYAKCIISEDTAECNRYLKINILNKLNTTANNLIELPQNIANMLSIEDVSVLFDNGRYVPDKTDDGIVKKIIDIWNTNDKLTGYGIRYLNSLLLYGESGCGKTTFGRYIAYKTGLPFAYLNFSHLISSYLGSTGKNIAEVFNYIVKVKCVFMLDEVDAIGLERGKDELGEMSRIVINLMQSLDKLDTGTIVIGATNRPDIIDKALIRRFSLRYEITKPDFEMRKAITEKYLSSIPEAVYTENDLESFAQSTDGLSCSAITNLIVDEIVQCLVENREIKLAS